MLAPRIKVDRGLYERLKVCAERAGYATVDELVTHVLEREAKQLEEAADEETLRQRLKGLGYIS